jgi:hypothetical protein
MQKVLFSFHAAQRMQQRLNTPISTKDEVNISSAFRKNLSYTCPKNGAVESWYCTIPGTRIVMIIGAKTRVVLTVMTEGPVVDAIYRAVMH